MSRDSRRGRPPPQDEERSQFGGARASGRVPLQDELASTYKCLKQMYNSHIRPLEEHYSFENFFSPPLTDKDIEAKPFVLLIGQYSVGKTSFINHLLGDLPKGYPGSNIGPEPTTDRFVAIIQGREDKILPGNAAAVNPGMPFTGLQAFGNAFLQKFNVAEMTSPILEDVTLIDTPGVLSGEKQRIGRNYDMSAVSRWFAERSDLILLLFDAHKLDISDELKQVIECLRGQDDKIRIVLNKSDQVTPQQLLRVYGALMWSLGKVFKTPEVARVYVSSFWRHPYCPTGAACSEIFDKEKEDLFRDLREIPRYAAVRRINEIVKRARLTKVHALVCATIRKMMPSMWSGNKKQQQIVDNLDIVFTAVSIEHNIPAGDFPEISVYRDKLDKWIMTGKSLKSMPKLDEKLIRALDDCLRNHLTELMSIMSFSEDRHHRTPDVLTPKTGSFSDSTPPQHDMDSLDALRSREALLSRDFPERDHASVRRGGDAGGDAGTNGAYGRGMEGRGGDVEFARAPVASTQSPYRDGGGYRDRDASSTRSGASREGGAGGARGGGLTDTKPSLLKGGEDAERRPADSGDAVKRRGWGGWGSDKAPLTRKRKIAIAHKGFKAEGADELTFEKGDEIEVSEQDSSGWWKGRMMIRGVVVGKEGWYPSNCVSLRE